MAGGVYTGGGATVIMDPPPVVYVNVFHAGSGPDRHTRAMAEKVALYARDNAPTKSGFMKSQIRVDQNRNELGQYAFGFSVVSPVWYSHYVHEGTDPSPRWPNSKRVMKFVGRDADTLYRDFVMHPGTPSQPFLQNALVAMVI